MSININPSDFNEVESELREKALQRSKIIDDKDSFKREEKEKAFLARYGKSIRTNWSYEMQGSQIIEYTMKVISKDGGLYSVTEYMNNGATVEVVLAYRRNGKNYKNRFRRYVDAEVTLSDLISQERNGNA